MAKVRSATATKKRHKKYLKAAKGYFGGRSKLYRPARSTVQRAWAFATEHRRAKKRDYRTLWIARISAAAQDNAITYSKLIAGLKKKNILLDRKSLSEIAYHDKKTFAKLVDFIKA